MACNKSNGPPPQDDPKNPNFICTNCHNNIYELCDECMERIDVQEILAKMQKNKGKDSTEPPKTTPNTTANNTQTISENETPENDTSDSQSLLEGGVLEGHDMNSENDTSDSQKECEDIPVNPSPPQIMDNQSYCDAQGGPSAVLVSITRTDPNNYRYEFKYEPPNTTPNTTPDNTQTMSENDTSNSQRECEGIHEGHDMDSDNFNYDDPITPGGFFLTPGQEKPEYESPFYDSDGNEVAPGHQL